MEFNKFSDEQFDESISIREVIEKYTAHFKWFVLSVLIFGVLAFLKLRYEAPKYKIDASILIKEQERGNSITNLQGFEDLGLFGMGDNNLQNEMQILTSRKLMTQVVQELKLNIRYFIEEKPYDRETYPNFPVLVHINSDSSTVDRISTSFEILVRDDKEFEFIDVKEINYGKRHFSKEFKADLGNKEDMIDQRLISIDRNNNFLEDLKGKKIKIVISPVEVVANYFMTTLNIEPVDERLSNVLNLFIEETVQNKGIALVNNLIEQYNADGINDKNLIAQTTINFLDKRLELISTELSAIEGTAARFKTQKGMVDVNTGASIYLQSSSMTDRDLVAANTQLELVNFMMEELRKSRKSEPLPGNIGLSDPSIVQMISEYNNLILQRNRILKSSSIKNPIIVNIDSQLAVLKNNLKVSLVNLRSSSQIQIDGLSRNRSKISSRIASVPNNEREFKEIVRQQETKNALFLFLLQKREESILSNAVNVDKAKVIDQAYSNGIPVSPKKTPTYIGAIILGILIPFLIIYIKDLLDTKVHDEKDLKRLRIPYLGDVPLAASKKNLYINESDNSSVAEAFRYVRTNISFMLDNKEQGKTVFVTSTQSHEGKTFTAINLASSLAISGKKTLLLAMDLRAPRISKYLGFEDKQGVTNFIKSPDLGVDDIIDPYTKFENLDIINSGDIPPNPVELLMSKRVEEIFEFVKGKYEFIIVDTAPVGMVTDTIQISKYADLAIYVIKANMLDKRMLHIPEKLYKERKLPKMAILINGTDHSKGAYGYGYGYGEKKKKTWYKRIFG